MFKIFTQDPRRKLEKKVEHLMSESYRLDEINPELANEKYAQAQSIIYQIEENYSS